MKQSHLGPQWTPSSAKAIAGTLVRTLEIAAVAALILGYVSLDRREDEVRARHDSLEAQAAAVASRLDAVRRTSDAGIDDLKTSISATSEDARAREDRLRQELDRAKSAVGVQERRLSQLTGLQEERLARSASEIGLRIEQLATQFAVDRNARVSSADRFRAIQEQADDAIYLIHCVFTYETREFDDDWKEHQATTWGTAFAVSDDGLLMTNKHLVMPWKFDSELAALEAMGEVRVKEDSVRLAAWPVGTACLDGNKKANFTTGSSTEKGTLAVVSTAEDTFNEKSVEMSGKTVKYKMHALDNHDLAVLRIAGQTRGLRFVPAPIEPTLKKLDPVMAIGFPRGVGGLESIIAVPSATLGSVRKIEDTVHISAPIVAGNSGGPVFDEEGRVIGVATRIYCETLGICIKAEHARRLVDRARLSENLATVRPLGGR